MVISSTLWTRAVLGLALGECGFPFPPQPHEVVLEVCFLQLGLCLRQEQYEAWVDPLAPARLAHTSTWNPHRQPRQVRDLQGLLWGCESGRGVRKPRCCAWQVRKVEGRGVIWGRALPSCRGLPASGTLGDAGPSAVMGAPVRPGLLSTRPARVSRLQELELVPQGALLRGLRGFLWLGVGPALCRPITVLQSCPREPC